jgi:hypothetical protein
MNRLAVASFAVVLGSASLAAQIPAPAQNPGQSAKPTAVVGQAPNLTLGQAQIFTQPGQAPAQRVFKFVPDGSEALAFGESPSIYVVPGPQGAGCPVSMRAEHGAGGGLVRTRQSRSNMAPGMAPGLIPEPTPPFQQIHLILGDSTVKSSAGAKVVGAKVTVRGTNGKWRTVPAAMGDDSSTISRTLDLSFDRAENGQVSTDMTLPGFTSVKSISLDSLTYSDDTVWIPPQEKICRVAPNPLMLVSTP